MAGLEGYESVYRGRAARSWEMNPPYSQKYHGREVIHPLDIPVMHPLAEDSPPIIDDGKFSFFFFFLTVLFKICLLMEVVCIL